MFPLTLCSILTPRRPFLVNERLKSDEKEPIDRFIFPHNSDSFREMIKHTLTI